MAWRIHLKLGAQGSELEGVSMFSGPDVDRGAELGGSGPRLGGSGPSRIGVYDRPRTPCQCLAFQWRGGGAAPPKSRADNSENMLNSQASERVLEVHDRLSSGQETTTCSMVAEVPP